MTGVLDLVRARDGHFRYESGHHARLWLELDRLFVRPDRVRPLVDRLADRIRPHGVDAVCGPLTGGAFVAQTVAASLGAEFLFTDPVESDAHDRMYGTMYVLPPALRGVARGKRVAIVDDVVSAGSAVRGTFAELRLHGARPVVVGALLVTGSAAAKFFAPEGIAVEGVEHRESELWTPEECPLCAAGIPVEDGAPAAGP